MELFITSDGSVKCLYDEAIDLTQLGQLSIQRASHVEPVAPGTLGAPGTHGASGVRAVSGGGGAGWSANLSPVRGPKLGPFPRRSQALAAERQWLEQHLATLTGL
jgi:hypothetical protein